MAADNRIVGAAGYIAPKYSFDITAGTGYVFSPNTLLFVRENYKKPVRAFPTELRKVTIPSTVGGGVEREIIEASLEYQYADHGSHGNTFDRHQALVGGACHFLA